MGQFEHIKIDDYGQVKIVCRAGDYAYIGIIHTNGDFIKKTSGELTTEELAEIEKAALEHKKRVINNLKQTEQWEK